MGRERASCSKRSAKVGLVAVRPSPAQVAILAVGWGSARAQLQVGARSRLRARVRIDCLHACLILGHRAPGVLRQDIQAAFLGHLAGGTKPGRRLRVTRSSIACARQSRLLDPPRAELLALRPRETPYRRGRRQKRGADRSRRVGLKAGAAGPEAGSRMRPAWTRRLAPRRIFPWRSWQSCRGSRSPSIRSTALRVAGRRSARGP